MALRRALAQLPAGGTRVAVGLSGGVDSSVAALALKAAGCAVTAVYARSWDARDEGSAAGRSGRRCDEAELHDARAVASEIGVDFLEADCVREYWQDVFEPFVAQVAAGAVGNPDIGCNRHVKFGALARFALGPDSVAKCDFLATGHYARLRHFGGKTAADVGAPGVHRAPPPELLMAADRRKDQSFFLCRTGGEQLRRVLFPLGDLHKSEVREIAREAGLLTAAKRDSVGICMVGQRNFKEFMEQYVDVQPGPIVSLTGEVLGEHRGAQLYVVGEKARIGGLPTKMFICGKDVRHNVVVVCPGHDHPALGRRAVRLRDVVWTAGHAPASLSDGDGMRIALRDRHQNMLKAGVATTSASLAVPSASSSAVSFEGPNSFHVSCSVDVAFDEVQYGMCDGQTGAIYSGEVCLGGGTIAFPQEDANKFGTEWERLKKPLTFQSPNFMRDQSGQRFERQLR